MLVSLERRPSLADYLGQRALAYFKHILSGHRAAARREAPSKWPPPTQSSFLHFGLQLARVRRRIPASGPWSLSFLPARTAGADPERPEPGRNKKDSDLFAVENHRPSLRHRHQGAVRESL